jgi:hypothetical protein
MLQTAAFLNAQLVVCGEVKMSTYYVMLNVWPSALSGLGKGPSGSVPDMSYDTLRLH